MKSTPTADIKKQCYWITRDPDQDLGNFFCASNLLIVDFLIQLLQVSDEWRNLTLHETIL